MRKFLLSSLVVGAALVLSAASSQSVGTESAAAAEMTTIVAVVESNIPGVPVDALPPSGECRIWYNEIPAAQQPAHMECEHAHWVARSWGGRVIENTADGAIEAAAYEGRNDFTGVSAEQLPRPGYCRAWVNADTQMEDTDCRTARRIAASEGGRVLFMPL